MSSSSGGITWGWTVGWIGFGYAEVPYLAGDLRSGWITSLISLVRVA